MRIPVLPVEGDTIAAVSTPYGVGGIGIVRISGPGAEGIARTLFRPKKHRDRLRSHTLYYGHILPPGSDEPVDEVLLTVMRAPNTYTREDMVEIHCHGGPLAVRRILESVLDQGARLAEPGEFTRRAFLNGRIDLAQAEAVVDVIEAKSRSALRFAQSQLSGRLSAQVRSLQESIRSLLVEIEAWLDFPDEDVPCPGFEQIRSRIDSWIASIEELLSTYEQGRLYRDGVKVVICGAPNVGKSTLLNALLGKDRAIVSPLPGTTRDYLEEDLLIGGIPVRLVDTAGLRDSAEEVEALGVDLARRKIEEADFVLHVLDASALDPGSFRDALGPTEAQGKLLVLNKMDLVGPEAVQRLIERMGPVPCVAVSALLGEGMDQLREAMAERLVSRKMDLDSRVVVTNLRHRYALESCRRRLEDAREVSARQAPAGDMFASDLRMALGALADLLGETTAVDILDRIFSSFCIGK
jgi:tRNA modification GTPase